MKRIYLIVALLLTGQAWAAPFTTAEWAMRLRGRSTDDTLSQSKSVAVFGFAHLAKEFNPQLLMRVEGGLRLESGSSQSLFTDEFEPKSQFILSDARVVWQPFKFAALHVGALSQEPWRTPIYMGSFAFPGAQELLTYRHKKFLFNFIAQQALPTTQNLSQRQIGKESTRFYLRKLLAAYTKAVVRTRASRSLTLNLKNLTHGMAQDSRFYGNTVIGIGPAASFLYSYRGVLAIADGSLELHKHWNILGGMSLVQNTAAPSGVNRGNYTYIGTTYRDYNIKITPRLERWRNEEDASLAFYSAREIGHNNRIGEGLSLTVSLPKNNLDISARWLKSRLIANKVFQRNNFTYVELNLETAYAGI